MISRKLRPWHKLVALLVALVILVLVVPGWGRSHDDSKTPVLTETPVVVMPTPAVTPVPATAAPVITPAPVPLNDAPVRIGLLCDYSGASALVGPMVDKVSDLVRNQVKEMGGILGGRSVKIEKADSKGRVTYAIAAFKKLVLDGVAVIVGGAASAAGTLANVETAEDYEIPYINWGLAPDDLADFPYTVRAITIKTDQIAQGAVDFAVTQLQPKRVALLLDNSEMYELADELKQRLKASGIEIVLTEFVPVGTLDFSPYLTKIKYHKADVIMNAFANPVAYMAIFKQVMELGGWGGMKFISVAPVSMLAAGMPGSEGTYHLVSWYPRSILKPMPYQMRPRF